MRQSPLELQRIIYVCGTDGDSVVSRIYKLWLRGRERRVRRVIPRSVAKLEKM